VVFGNCAAWRNVGRKRRGRRVVRMFRGEGKVRIVVVCCNGGNVAQEESSLLYL